MSKAGCRRWIFVWRNRKHRFHPDKNPRHPQTLDNSPNTPQPAYDNLCGLQVESDEARRHLYFHWSVNFYFYLCEALFAAPSFKLIFKNNKFLYLYYRMPRPSEMSLILNFQTLSPNKD
jgi:hypothetical protein